MKVLIVDDELPARARMAALLKEVCAPCECVGEAGDGASAVRLANELRPDLVLLDIRMPGMDGIEAALRMSGLEESPAVVFVTAYDEHALAAFDAGAIDYLLKPVRAERLLQALQKATRLDVGQQQQLVATREFLTVRYRGGLQRIPLGDVVCLLADQKYVEVVHAQGVALLEESLKSIEQRLPERFLRIHRNALVDPGRIRELVRQEGGACQLLLEQGPRPLEVSRRHLPAVRRLLRN